MLSVCLLRSFPLFLFRTPSLPPFLPPSLPLQCRCRLSCLLLVLGIASSPPLICGTVSGLSLFIRLLETLTPSSLPSSLPPSGYQHPASSSSLAPRAGLRRLAWPSDSPFHDSLIRLGGLGDTDLLLQ